LGMDYLSYIRFLTIKCVTVMLSVGMPFYDGCRSKAAREAIPGWSNHVPQGTSRPLLLLSTVLERDRARDESIAHSDVVTMLSVGLIRMGSSVVNLVAIEQSLYRLGRPDRVIDDSAAWSAARHDNFQIASNAS